MLYCPSQLIDVSYLTLERILPDEQRLRNGGFFGFLLLGFFRRLLTALLLALELQFRPPRPDLLFFGFPGRVVGGLVGNFSSSPRARGRARGGEKIFVLFMKFFSPLSKQFWPHIG